MKEQLYHRVKRVEHGVKGDFQSILLCENSVQASYSMVTTASCVTLIIKMKYENL